MNLYTLIILSAIVADFILSLISDILNLKHLSPDLPETFRDVFDADRYRKSQEYTRVTTRFGFITSIFNLIVTLAFWFAGGFNFLDQMIRAWTLHPIWNGLIFVGMLLMARSILSLPFSIYSTFVIEEKFGFNKTTVKTFILDLVKGFALSLIIGGPLLAGILALFLYAGPIAWLYCWAVTTLFTLFIQFIAPAWIMPLFNKFTPLEEGELRKRILEYAGKVRYSLSGVFVMDGSKRSSKSNAFFTGFGKNKRIALFDTLIQKHTVPELVAVLAHEIGHYKKKHILIGMGISILHTGVLFFLLSLFLTQKELFDAFFMENTSIYAGMLFFGMLYAPVEMILSIFMNMLSRRHEYQADRFAAETTKEVVPFIDALKKLSAHNLSNLTPHPFHVFLNYSHPPVLKRIQTLQKEFEG
jgi:STE24 endopeptidase